jgi:hypothetical protein
MEMIEYVIKTWEVLSMIMILLESTEHGEGRSLKLTCRHAKI